MRSVLLILARLASAGWVGAATLFVVSGVRELRSPAFDSVTKDALVLTRFPAYYAFGFVLVGIALVCGWAARNHSGGRTCCLRIAGALLLLTLIAMVVDYQWIYTPLTVMLNEPATARDARFVGLHRMSMWINAADLLTCALAAVLLNWPAQRPSNATDAITGS